MGICHSAFIKTYSTLQKVNLNMYQKNKNIFVTLGVPRKAEDLSRDYYKQVEAAPFRDRRGADLLKLVDKCHL